MDVFVFPREASVSQRWITINTLFEGRLRSNGAGLGVKTVGDDEDVNRIDGRGSDELAVFRFTQPVAILAITFSGVDPRDDVRIFMQTQEEAQRSLIEYDRFKIDADGLQPADAAVVTFATPLIGQTLGIGATGQNDNFRVRAIHGERVAPPTVVPLPPGAALMLGALGLGFLLRRRQPPA